MTTTPMSPIQVRSVRCVESDMISSPVVAAEASGTTAVDAGTYLHRDDVVALLEGYAEQLKDNFDSHRVLMSMAEHIKMRGV